MTDFSLIETMRFKPGTGLVRARLHRARLQRSATRLGFKGWEQAWDSLLSRLGEMTTSPTDQVRQGCALGPPPSVPPGHLPLKWGDSMGAEPTHHMDQSLVGLNLTLEAEPLRSRPISPLEGEMSASPTEGGNPPTVPASSSPTPATPSPANALRVRLELFPDGRADITTAPFTPLPDTTIWRVAIATTRLSSSDRLLQHKTSRRETYDRARAEFPRETIDEVILLNEKGELCEGTITSLFLDDGTGLLKTPPLASGLLAGVLRTELVCQRRARAQRLTLDNLARGTLYVGNSLRGLIRAELV